MGEGQEREWTDKRLDDRFEAMERQMKTATDSIAEDLSELKVLVIQQSVNLNSTIEGLAAERLAASKAELEKAKQQRKDRLSDFRWMVGTLIAVMGILIAGIGLMNSAGVI